MTAPLEQAVRDAIADHANGAAKPGDDLPTFIAHRVQALADAGLLSQSSVAVDLLRELFSTGPVNVALAGNPNACDDMIARIEAVLAPPQAVGGSDE